MKMRPGTYADLNAAVAPIMAHVAHAGLSERLRWDCLFASKFSLSRLYAEGLNDANIDTALRVIASTINISKSESVE